MRKTKFFVVLLALTLLVSIPLDAAAADSTTLSISTPEQLIRLAGRCRLDSWSRGITVRLLNDIDLTEYDFEPIPTFGGRFEGQGHTIKGLTLSASGSAVGGLFRYLQNGAIVRNLTVEGKIAPEANASGFGGIVGENNGRIVNCTFNGTVEGVTDIGGIAGVNNISGEIYKCRSRGSISGEHYTGGIVGRNLGTVINCTNFASVNTTNIEIQPDKLTIDWENINSTENTALHTDTGGIAGFSLGIVQSCINYGYIGYPHVGYNIGGIVGRQSGYMYECENFGEINGRKDIGGIIGQMVPHIRMQYDIGAVAALRSEMTKLEGMINAFITNFESSSSEITGILASAGEHLDAAGSSAGIIVDNLAAFVDGNVETVNTLMATVARYIEKFQPILSNLKTGMEHLTTALEHLSDTVAALEDASEDLSHVVALIKYGAEKLEKATDSLQNTLDHLQKAIEIMQEALEGYEWPEEGEGEDEENDGEEDDGEEDDGEIPDIGDILDGVLGGENVSPDMTEAVSKALEEVYAATEDLEKAGEYMDDGLNNGLLPALDEMELLLNDADKITGPMQKALDSLGLAGDNMSKVAAGMEKWVEDFSKEEPLVFQNLGDEFSNATDRLEGSMVSLSEDMEKLNSAVSNATTVMSDDLRNINAQFFLVMDAFLALIDGTQTTESVYEDMSEEELFSATEGKAEDCVNKGCVSGDVNVGGLVGTIAIEYDLDPEEDISVSGTKNSEFKYFMNAALLAGCNYGDVTAKKDAVGGVVGYMDLGIVYGTENYGDVSSTSGDYVGGIAGESSAILKRSWSLCTVSGRNYVGGIAGSGTDIIECRSIVKTSATGGWCGAIAGEAVGEVSQNYFVGRDQGAVDGISYEGCAQPQQYAVFVLNEDIPSEFLDFNLTFIADGKTVARIGFDYGDSFDTKAIPDVPEKAGYVGEWEKYDFSNLEFSHIINAVYTPYDSVVAVSEEEANRALVLLEGAFMPGSVPELVSTDGINVPEKLGEIVDLRSVVAHGKVDRNYYVRYLAPIDPEDIVIYVFREGGWQRVETTVESSYVKFRADGDTVTFAVFERDKNFPAIEVSVTAAALLLVAAIIILVKRSRRKKTAKAVTE